MKNPARAQKSLAACNDELRRNLYSPGKHRIQMTTGLTVLIGDTSKWLNFRLSKRILRAVHEFEFDDSDAGNRDLGFLVVDDPQLFFRIVAFDNALALRSPDPTDESRTTRVLTIMLSHEY
jgi:hypothetical protein